MLRVIIMCNDGNSSPGKDTINFEAWTKENPDVGHFIVFGHGCLCYAHISKGEQQKSDGKAKRITLGCGT